MATAQNVLPGVIALALVIGRKDQVKMALMGGAAIIIAMLLWIFLSFLN